MEFVRKTASRDSKRLPECIQVPNPLWISPFWNQKETVFDSVTSAWKRTTQEPTYQSQLLCVNPADTMHSETHGAQPKPENTLQTPGQGQDICAGGGSTTHCCNNVCRMRGFGSLSGSSGLESLTPRARVGNPPFSCPQISARHSMTTLLAILRLVCA